MDLQTFVAETLTQIVGGVREATQRISELGTNAKVNPVTVRYNDNPEARKTSVEFDVAVTVVQQEDDRTNDKVAASAGILSVVSARIAGEAANEKLERSRNEMISRVRFSVELAQPSEINDRTKETAADNERIRSATARTGSSWGY
jgi:hypothetical protein